MSNATAFSALNLAPALLGNLTDIGYLEMMPVQANTLPYILAGSDVLARARTGSGKTAAFGLGLLNNVDPASFRVQGLVLCPTRELAEQVAREIRRLAQAIPNIKVLSLCGGAPIRQQNASLQHHPHIVVGTPGRVLKHLKSATMNLRGLRTFVLDEADRMLDMGFADELDAILAFVPETRQTLLFSATYPEEIAGMSARVQRDPVVVDVTKEEQPVRISQRWCAVTANNRDEAMLRALCAWGGALNLVFCNTRADCMELTAFLQSNGVAAVALHGELDQPRRTHALVRFSNRSASVLVATDVAARGLDVEDVDVVFNYELPAQPEVYIHRIGRTGRLGKKGDAVSLVQTGEMRRLRAIESLLPDDTLRSCAIPDAKRMPACLTPVMKTIQVNGGRKNRLRPGDLLGALTAEGGVPGDAVGAIDLFQSHSYIAVRQVAARKALQQLRSRPIKGRKYRARILK